jgi:hypothetical protein
MVRRWQIYSAKLTLLLLAGAKSWHNFFPELNCAALIDRPSESLYGAGNGAGLQWTQAVAAV